MNGRDSSRFAVFGDTVPGSIAERQGRGAVGGGDAVGMAVHGVGRERARARDKGGEGAIWVWELHEAGDASFDPRSLAGPGGFGVCRGVSRGGRGRDSRYLAIGSEWRGRGAGRRGGRGGVCPGLGGGAGRTGGPRRGCGTWQDQWWRISGGRGQQQSLTRPLLPSPFARNQPFIETTDLLFSCYSYDMLDER
jgi:hypothetical protein